MATCVSTPPGKEASLGWLQGAFTPEPVSEGQSAGTLPASLTSCSNAQPTSKLLQGDSCQMPQRHNHAHSTRPMPHSQTSLLKRQHCQFFDKVDPLTAINGHTGVQSSRLHSRLVGTSIHEVQSCWGLATTPFRPGGALWGC